MPSYRTSVASRCGCYRQTTTNSFLPNIAARVSTPRTLEGPRRNGRSLARYAPKDGSPLATLADSDWPLGEIRRAGSHSGRDSEMSEVPAVGASFLLPRG